MRKFIVILTLMLLVSGVYAQSTTGTEFWLSFLENDDTAETLLYITSDVGATGTASIPGSGWSENFTIPANGSVQVTIPDAENAAIEVGNTIFNRGVKVVSDSPVAVYAANQRNASSDATLAMPVDGLGDSYYINAYTPFNTNNPSQFVIVGVEDNTSIEIVPSAAVTGGSAAGVTFNITINQGEVYLVKSTGDLTGTSVKATDVGVCNNFAIFAGNKCANVPLSCTYCDHIYEQMIPVKAWGLEYVTVPLMTRSGDTFRILASVHGTNVTIDGGAPIVLNEGEFHEVHQSDASFIQADNPISVAQYSEGTSCDGVTSDPFMIMLSPVEQTLDYIVFQAFTTTAINQFYTNIVAETPNTGLVEFNGVPVAGWTVVPSNPAYSYARMNVAQGTHVITSSEGTLATVYGFGDVESYGYLAGANVVPLNVSFDIVVDGTPEVFDEFVDTLACSQTTVDFQSNSDNISDISWDFGDGSPIFYGNPVVGHEFPPVGDWIVTMYFTRDGSCVEQSLEMTVHTNSTMPPIAQLADSIVCNGDPYTVEFNIPDVNYSWHNGATTSSFVFDHTGDYSLTVTDAIGCAAVSSCHVDFVDITVSATTQNMSCNGVADGSITANPNGGNAPYDYIWDTSPSENTQTIAGLDVGTYSVTVTENLGCTAETSASMIEPPLLTANIDNVSHISCFGFDDGAANISINGGTEPYDIIWSDASLSGLDPSGMAPGAYQFSFTDANGCDGAGSITIDDVEEFLIDGLTTDVECYGQNTGEVQISVSGGVLPYSFSWSNSQITEDLHNIPADIYIVTVTDSHDCTVSATYEISQPEQLETVIHSQNIDCYGRNTGQVLLNVLGGTYPYQYIWNNGSPLQNQTDLFPGNYIVTVVDANGCSVYDYAQISQPSFPLHGEITATDVRCFNDGDGAADLYVFGGTEPYYYEWNNTEISEDLDLLSPGIYMVTITDDNGCVTADTVQIFQPDAPISGTINGSNVTCNGGTNGNVYLTDVSGGRPPYHFEWNNGSWEQNLIGVEAGTYSVTITDDSFCHYEQTIDVTEPEPFYIQPMDDPTICYGMNAEIGVGVITGNVPPYTVVWNNNDTGMTTMVNPLETTIYNAHVIDAAHCVSEDFEITVNVHDSLSMSVVASADTVCPNTPVTFIVDIQGGGIVADSVFVNDSIMAIPVSIEVFSDTVLNFMVFDACNYHNALVSMPIVAYELPPIDITADKYNGCAPLSVQFAEETDDFGQRYIWNFDDGDFENLSFDKYPPHTFFNSRTYHVNLKVISPEGCENDSTIGITVFPVPDADFRASNTNVSLSYPIVYFTNYSDGGFFYNWSFGDGGLSTATNPSHSYTEAGLYDVVLSAVSLYGCVDTSMVQINVNNELAVYAPTAFTPNFDDINEEFKVILSNVDIETYNLTIFSRWGDVVFESEDYDEAWNGRYGEMLCNPGVYTWVVVFTDLYGNEYTEAGYFTLIR